MAAVRGVPMTSVWTPLRAPRLEVLVDAFLRPDEREVVDQRVGHRRDRSPFRSPER